MLSLFLDYAFVPAVIFTAEHPVTVCAAIIAANVAMIVAAARGY